MRVRTGAVDVDHELVAVSTCIRPTLGRGCWSMSESRGPTRSGQTYRVIESRQNEKGPSHCPQGGKARRWRTFSSLRRIL